MLSALLVLLGLVGGSFAGVVAARGPARWGLIEGETESFVTGRSACDSCGRKLGARDLAPVASFLAAFIFLAGVRAFNVTVF